MRQGNKKHWRECGATWRTFGSPANLRPSLKRPSPVSKMPSLYFFRHCGWAVQVWDSKPSYVLLRVCVVQRFARIAPGIYTATPSAPYGGSLIIATIRKETESLRGWMTKSLNLWKVEWLVQAHAWLSLCRLLIVWVLGTPAAVKCKLLQMPEQWVRWER